MDFGKTKYEQVWVGDKGQLYARLWDPFSKTSNIYDLKYDYIPSLYIEDEYSEGPFKSFTNGRPLTEIKFDKVSDIYSYLKSNDNSKLYGYNNRPHKFIRDTFPNTVDCNHEFHEWFLDIETRSLNGFEPADRASQEITMIQIYDSKINKYILLGRKKFTATFEQENVEYYHIEDEKQLLRTFLNILNKAKPSVIKSFNGLLFDYPYITNRIKNLGLDFTLLSPVKTVKFKDGITQDGMTGITALWEGIYLIDLRELFLKYAYAGLASNSLNNVSKFYGFESKIDHSEFDTFDGQYSGKGYMFPDKAPEGELDLKIYETQVNYKNNPTPKNWAEVEQACFNKFTIYSIKDVELMVKIENKAKLFNTAKGIAYVCGVNIDEVAGTLKQWRAFVYKECMENNLVLPIQQQYGDPNCIYKAGWTRSLPGKYNWVASFDFTSLYPSLFQAFNVGTDTMIKPEELEQMPELKEIKEKYFNYFTLSNVGSLEIKYKGNTNDIIEETQYYQSLMDNKGKIIPVLKKYDVTATPNGQFFRRDKESISSILMRRIFNDRITHKRNAQRLYGELEEIKAEMKKRGL